MNGTEATKDCRAGQVGIVAEAMVDMFGARAPAVVERQIAVAEGEARISWEEILIRVRTVLATPR